MVVSCFLLKINGKIQLNSKILQRGVPLKRIGGGGIVKKHVHGTPLSFISKDVDKCFGLEITDKESSSSGKS